MGCLGSPSPGAHGLYDTTVDSKKLASGFREIYAGVPSSLGFGVPTFWLLLIPKRSGLSAPTGGPSSKATRLRSFCQKDLLWAPSNPLGSLSRDPVKGVLGHMIQGLYWAILAVFWALGFPVLPEYRPLASLQGSERWAPMGGLPWYCNELWTQN